MATIVEEQRLVVATPCTYDLKVETARSEQPISSDIYQGDAVLACYQQRPAIVKALQAERLAR